MPVARERSRIDAPSYPLTQKTSVAWSESARVGDRNGIREDDLKPVRAAHEKCARFDLEKESASVRTFVPIVEERDGYHKTASMLPPLPLRTRRHTKEKHSSPKSYVGFDHSVHEKKLVFGMGGRGSLRVCYDALDQENLFDFIPVKSLRLAVDFDHDRFQGHGH